MTTLSRAYSGSKTTFSGVSALFGEDVSGCVGSNHLGNVLAVITDRKIPRDTDGDMTTDYYVADVISATDYSPFGARLYGRSFNTSEYRYSFQNQEHDDEIKGGGNSVNYSYRMYDTRLGRFLSLDPIASQYPHNSPYVFAENQVINGIELEGLEHYYTADGNYIGFVKGGWGTRVVDAGELSKKSFTYLKKYINYANAEKEHSWKASIKIFYDSRAVPNWAIKKADESLWVPIYQASKSETFVNLVKKNNEFADGYLMSENEGTYTEDATGNINIGKSLGQDDKILGLTWELANRSNQSELVKLSNRAYQRADFSEKDFVMGKFKVEAEAFLARASVASDLNISDPMTEQFSEDISKMKNGEIKREDVIQKIAEWGYNNATSRDKAGNTIILRDEYAKQYQDIRKMREKAIESQKSSENE